MTQDILQKKTAHSRYVCQKCKSLGAAKPLVMVPKQLVILCEDGFLQYCEIFPIEDRKFVRDGHGREIRVGEI